MSSFDAVPPTKRQLRYLGYLAAEKGQSFPVPATAAAASRLIGQLKDTPPFRNRFLSV